MEKHIILLLFLLSFYDNAFATLIPVNIDVPAGAVNKSFPVRAGIPFPEADETCLMSAENIRLLDKNGAEIPVQVTKVNSWYNKGKRDKIKAAWLDFLADVPASKQSAVYYLEYGKDISRKAQSKESVKITKTEGGYEVVTGLLKMVLSKGENFISQIWLDSNRNGVFEDSEKTLNGNAGLFADMSYGGTPSASKAIVESIEMEDGGPVLASFCFKGRYEYPNKKEAPFVVRLQVFGGKSYLRIYDTWVFNGEGAKKPDWTKPYDQLVSLGITFPLNLTGTNKCFYGAGGKIIDCEKKGNEYYINQSSYKKYDAGNGVKEGVLEGWFNVNGENCGVSAGIRNVYQEFPKEISYDSGKKEMRLSLYPKRNERLAFVHKKNASDDGVCIGGNRAIGLAKTHEFFVDFHIAKTEDTVVRENALSFLEPSIVLSDRKWIAASRVFGYYRIFDDTSDFGGNLSGKDIENGLRLTAEWWLYNQQSEPWYGFYDYGDFQEMYNPKKNTWNYLNGRYAWNCGEMANDYGLWMQFLRTGRRDYYLASEAMTKHFSDIDRGHLWSTPFPAVDKYENKKPGILYGAQARHNVDHWRDDYWLRDHTYIQGEVIMYYLFGYRRAMDTMEEALYAMYNIFDYYDNHEIREWTLPLWNMVDLWDLGVEIKYPVKLSNKDIEKEMKRRFEQLLKYQCASGQWPASHHKNSSEGCQGPDIFDFYTNAAIEDYYDFTGNGDELAIRLNKAFLKWCKCFLATPVDGLEPPEQSSARAMAYAMRISSDKKAYQDRLLNSRGILSLSRGGSGKIDINNSKSENYKSYAGLKDVSIHRLRHIGGIRWFTIPWATRALKGDLPYEEPKIEK